MDKASMEIRLNHWMPLFEAQAKSGMTKGKWCEENGIPRWEFFQRQREIRSYLIAQECSQEPQGEPQQNLPAFLEIPVDAPEVTPEKREVRQAPLSPKDNCIDISYRGFKIKLTGEVDPSSLEVLVRSLSHA